MSFNFTTTSEINSILFRSTYVSVLTIVAFSMERFLAICHPLHLYAMSGFKRAVRIIAVLWIVSFLSAVPFGIYSDVHYLDYPPLNGTGKSSGYMQKLSNNNYSQMFSSYFF